MGKMSLLLLFCHVIADVSVELYIIFQSFFIIRILKTGMMLVLTFPNLQSCSPYIETSCGSQAM